MTAALRPPIVPQKSLVLREQHMALRDSASRFGITKSAASQHCASVRLSGCGA